jgi:hypothetical protein
VCVSCVCASSSKKCGARVSNFYFLIDSIIMERNEI